MSAEPFPHLWLPGQGRLSVFLHRSGPREFWVNVGRYHQQGHWWGSPVSWQRQPCKRLAPHIRNCVPQPGVSISSKAMRALILRMTIFVYLFFFFILGGGRVAWGEKQIWRHKEKSEGGIRGISHLQIYLLIWKGSQHWWQAEKGVKK